jgi:signal transduction histidine kinase
LDIRRENWSSLQLEADQPGRPGAMPQVLNNRWAQSAIVAVLFAATGQLGHLLAIPPGLATPIWLPSGISVSAFILLGPRIWPGVFAGATLVSTLPLLGAAEPSAVPFALAIGVLIGLAVTSEPFLAAWLYRRSSRGGALLRHPRNVSALLLLAGPVSCACAATLASVTLAASGKIGWLGLPETWVTWMVGDLAGIYMLVPAVLVWTQGDTVQLESQDRAIVPLAVAGIALACLAAFLDDELIGSSLRLAFLPFPLVVFIAYRFNDRLASVIGAAVAAAAIVATANDRGPFGEDPTNLALIDLQIFTLVGIATALFTRAIANQRDAAEREAQRLSTDLAHLSRVTLMSELAAGIAHEYHQPLTAISNYASASLRLLRKHEDARREIGAPLQRIADEAVRAASIVDQLREFLQKRPPRRIRCDANEIVNDAVRLIQMAHSFPNISLRCRLAPGLPAANVDAVQITQILVNLLLNSCEAIASNGNGHGNVQVTTRTGTSGRIGIYVEDDGPGMSSETAQSCFDQFYSTKEGGLGVGLGVSRTLARAHGGSLVLERSNGRGTRFCLELPVHEEPPFTGQL